MDVSNVPAAYRFALGAFLTLVGASIGQANLGLMTRLSGLATLLGIGFLGAAVEPPLTDLLGADRWDGLSATGQTVIAFLCALVALVSWFLVRIVGGVVVDAAL